MNQRKLNPKQLKAIKYIRNRLIHYGQSPSIREIMNALNYKSPRSAALILQSLIEQGIIRRRQDGDLRIVKDIEENESHGRTVNLPLLGTASCGAPLLAEENIEAMIPVSKSLISPGHTYFLLRATGDSMDKVGINDGDLLLVRQQSVAENGENVVALIDDEATVKEFHQTKGATILKPRSKDKKHQPIILTDNFKIQGVVVTIIPKF